MSKFSENINLSPSKFIVEWNSKYPYDRWWRKKYNIPFGSKLHREASFIDMVIEYKEDLFFLKLSKKDEESDEDKELERQVDEIIASSSDDTKNGKKVVKMSKKDIDEEFDDLDLDQFNK